METKICNNCKDEKLICYFGTKRNTCKICYSNYLKLWRKENKDTAKSQQKLRDLNRRTQNPLKEKERQKKYFLNNKVKINEQHKKYTQKKRKSDILFKLSDNIKSRLRQFLKSKNISKNNKTFEIVGCTSSYLKQYLESKFIINMCWENYGEWHIDHIIPLSSAKTEEEIYKLCHYTNLQPLWAKDNLRKSNKLDYLYLMVNPNI